MIQVNEFLKMTVSLFAIVEPIGIVPFFLSVTHGWTHERTHAAARAAALTVLVVLMVSLLLGEGLLSVFGISLASFAVGGGLPLGRRKLLVDGNEEGQDKAQQGHQLH